MFTISIVSHGQGRFVSRLLEDLRSLHGPPFEILLTLNIPEDKRFLSDFKDLPITVLENLKPKGFGANHNCAFRASSGDVFVVVNPDIRAPDMDISNLLSLAGDAKIGAVAPKVLNGYGLTEDSARRFPTFFRFLFRVLMRKRDADYDLNSASNVSVEWVAGMFIAFPRKAFDAVDGFDTRYFMYLEDADICRRLLSRGYITLVDCSTTVVHDAQRASRCKLRHFSWHLRSALRFLTGI